jgi:hypothetical protein
MAETAAGQRVTALFESILHSAPTGQQLTHWVHELRSGVGANVLRKDLTAQAKAQAATPTSAAMNVVIGGGSSASASSAANITGRADVAAVLPNGANSAVAATGLNVRQLPAGWSFTVSFDPPPGPPTVAGTGSNTTTQGSATGTTSTGTMTSGGTTTSTGMTSAGGTTTSTGMMSSGGTMTSGGMMSWG